MSLTLYGSLTSPYVRRIRLFMADITYEFSQVNIFEEDSRAQFRPISPIKKLPVLKDGDQLIFDSHVIYHHLRKIKNLAEAGLKEANQISVIDAVTDANIILQLSRRSGLESEEDRLIFRLQRERIPDSLKWLEQAAEQGEFDSWHYGSMSLVAMMDWLEFRKLHFFEKHPVLQAVRQRFSDLAEVQSTQPIA